MASTVFKQGLLLALTETTTAIDFALAAAVRESKDNVETFLTEKYGCLGKLIGIYKDLLQTTGVKSKDELQSLWEPVYTDQQVRNAVEDLITAEDNWNTFLLNIEKRVNTNLESVPPICVGDRAPVDASLLNVKTGETTSLPEITAANAKILAIFFGTREAAAAWIEQTGCENLEVFISQDKALYKDFGLGRSVYKVWNTDSLMYFGEQLAQGKTLPNFFQDCKEDVHQMGGDIIVSKQGKVAFIYRSKKSIDRPSPDQLISVLKTLK